jgi:hypothetical protein
MPSASSNLCGVYSRRNEEDMRVFIIVAALALLQACAPLAVFSDPDPADPRAPVPRQTYVPVTSGTKHYAPAEPKPWAETNQGVAPKEKTP